jgi:deoxyribonuclease-4
MDIYFELMSSILAGGAPAAGPLRVRQVLDKMHPSSRAALRRLVPIGDPPSVETARYPSALLSFFPKPNNYSCVGLLAEYLLRMRAEEIKMIAIKPAVLHVLALFGIPFDAKSFDKMMKSKTTAPFLELLVNTRKAMDVHIRGELRGESVLYGKNVMGHPDARTIDQIYEIKLTGDLNKNWSYFLCQVHAYAALDKSVNDVYIVLPLQSTVVHFDVRTWTERTAFAKKLESAAEKLLAPAPPTTLVPSAGLDILARYNIGSHMPKFPTLLTTVKKLPIDKPSQIFIGAPQNSRLVLKDADIAAAASWIATNHLNVYIHAPYLINLATMDAPDDWIVKLLKKNLEVGVALGCRGVVVHVGKSKGEDVSKATENMQKNIIRVLESATEACPLLLETPAGQGSELLRGQAEFIDFVRSFETPRLRICLDTCHVFACGHKPIDFVDSILDVDPDLLRLIHFNDSMDICGACKDRHAFVGTGKIGLDVLESVAERATLYSIPLVIE